MKTILVLRGPFTFDDVKNASTILSLPIVAWGVPERTKFIKEKGLRYKHDNNFLFGNYWTDEKGDCYFSDIETIV